MLNNSVQLVGNLGRDPILRTSNSGRSVCNFAIAVDNHRSRDKQGKPDWFDIVVWGEDAEHQARYLQAGSKVMISGYLQPRSYKNRDGMEVFKMDIVAREIMWLGRIRSPDTESPHAE